MNTQLTSRQSATLFDLVCELVHERFDIHIFIKEIKDSWKEAIKQESEELQKQIDSIKE